MSTVHDSAIVESVLSGQRDAFRSLVERYFETVRMVALAKTGNAADAEDVAQDTFLKAYESLGTLRSRDKLAPWLVSIARNHAISLVRRRERERRNVEAAAPCDSDAPDYARRELLDGVARQVDALPLNLREVVLLHYFEGLKCREIGERLDMSTNAVVKRLTRGREALGDRLLREWGEATVERGRDRAQVARVMGAVAALPAPDWSGQALAAGTGGWMPALTMSGLLSSNALWIGGAILLVALAGGMAWWRHAGNDFLSRAGKLASADDSLQGAAAAGATDSASAEGDDVRPGSEGVGVGTATADSVTGAPGADSTDSGRGTHMKFGPGYTYVVAETAPGDDEIEEEAEDKEAEEQILLGAIEGEVVAEDSASPVEGAAVSVRGKQYAGEAISGPDGGFRVEIFGSESEDGDGEPNLYMVSARLENLVSDTLFRVPLDTGGVQLVLKGRGMVRGIVVDAETKRPLPSFEARISRQQAGSEGIMGSGLPWSRFESEDGFFELPTEADLGELAFRATSYREAKLRLELPRGDLLEDVVIELQPGTPFRGIVQDAVTRAPVAGAAVGIVMGEVRQWWGISENNFSISTRTDEDGVFRLQEVAAGMPFDLIVWHEAFAPQFVVDLDAGLQPEIRLYLTQGGQISGTVKRDGVAIEGLRMWVGLSFGRPMEHTALGSDDAVFLALSGTGGGGNYAFSQLPPGRYQIRAMAADPSTPLAKRYLTRRWVDVVDGENTVMDFNIETEGSVSGFVSGVDDMSVVELRLYDQRFPTQTLYSTAERHDSAAPDSSGHFQFPPVTEGSYYLRASIPEIPDAVAEAYFEVVAGQDTEVALAFDLPELPPGTADQSAEEEH